MGMVKLPERTLTICEICDWGDTIEFPETYDECPECGTLSLWTTPLYNNDE